ncbi:arsenite efflux ATP-binding protein ArsA [Frankia sp. EI5c]|uniref:ArsA family ATPase n=1 Tax=Frankia sp. EI5c TaxID=683316 RepID=UPI0007C2E24D|nr:ArsA family ATPase [Frankia sp. EI5c]OAA28282.1 arsenite efflux ATP-binding protein ArsA [Frankia sp. EI5c]
MRCVFLTGKGGGGTTTVAAATATLAAQRGHRTLVVSVDPAAGLAGVLDHPLGPTEVELEPGLFAIQTDLRHAFAERWPRVREMIASWAPDSDLDLLEVEELLRLPGALPALTLLELRDLVRADRYDVVVVDAGPAGSALRLLASPETLAWGCRRLGPPDGALARWMRPPLSLSGRLVGRLAAMAGPAYQAVSEMAALAHEMRALLADPAITSVRLVLTPETSALAQARRTLSGLSLHGIGVDAVIVNRVIGHDGGDAWRAGWAAAHRDQLVEIAALVAPLPVLAAAYRAGEPLGLEELAAFGAAAYGPRDPAAVLSDHHGGEGAAPRVERTEAGYVMSFGLPFVDRSEVDLARVGDDLVVSVGADRRHVPLPAALRRCDVLDAHLAEDRLLVSFVPDPAQWVRA